MTSKTAAILVRESKGLLVTRQQPGPIPSHLLSTTGEFDCVMAAIRLGGGGGGGGETGGTTSGYCRQGSEGTQQTKFRL